MCCLAHKNIVRKGVIDWPPCPMHWGLTFQYANNFRSAGREFLNGLSIREELVHQGKIPVDQICQILRRIKHLLEIYPDKPLEDLLSKKLMEWSICKVAD